MYGSGWAQENIVAATDVERHRRSGLFVKITTQTWPQGFASVSERALRTWLFVNTKRYEAVKTRQDSILTVPSILKNKTLMNSKSKNL